MLQIERRPELCKKIAHEIFHKIGEELIRPIEMIAQECDNEGYVNVLDDNDIGCEAANHHILCDEN